MERLKTPPAEVAHALLVLLRRGSVRATENLTGHTNEIISRWPWQAAHAAALATNLRLTEVEVEEFWSFVQHKGVTERWGCLSADRPNRFVVGWAAGPRTADLAEQVVQTTWAHTAAQASIPWIRAG